MLFSIALLALVMSPCNCVSFRLDDIRDYYERDGQIDVIRLFAQQNATLTVGVIGSALGNDSKLVEFLKENSHTIEFANHGWLHEDFSVISAEEQTRLMNQTNNKIQELFGIRPVTFIAPFNRLNTDTGDAVYRNGMSILTADEKHDSPALVDGRVYHLPVNANVSDYDEEALRWKSFENAIVLSDVRKGIERDGYAIIMMHPRDFVDPEGKADPAKIEELRKLVAQLREDGVRIVSVQEIAGIHRAPEFDSIAALAVFSGTIGTIIATRRLRKP